LDNRERHEARRTGLEAMPLDQHMKRGHGIRESRMERRPAPMHDLLAMADHGQHGEHRLNKHAVLPRAALTEFEVGGPTRGRMAGGITQDNHPSVTRSNEPLKGGIDVSTTILSSRHCLLDSCGITYLLC